MPRRMDVARLGPGVSMVNILATAFLLVGVPPADLPLPVGRWPVEFANGVVEICEVRQDGTATVAEPLRTSSGRITARDGGFVRVFDDDRIERWRPVGRRMLVEHW